MKKQENLQIVEKGCNKKEFTYLYLWLFKWSSVNANNGSFSAAAQSHLESSRVLACVYQDFLRSMHDPPCYSMPQFQQRISHC